ncbi:hypothetical protein D915_010938 [Fasciola hepatica]|uniref:Uncharacterized protein n=1 Tax=Fasciola hepatica TaxID=6192 RepID=A0A2H1BRJ9_FASHE|nr:hypothetical protein D915_010937 [Fasciola hepatica]THD18114.1 hypothetical protein D915_010938 [Fasciola hepatica]
MGRELSLPIELTTPVIPGNAVIAMNHTQKLRRRRQEAFRFVRVRTKVAQERQNKIYDLHVRIPECAAGDQFYLFGPRSPQGSPGKFRRPWQGPFKVISIRSPSVYVPRQSTTRDAEVLTVN